MIVVMDTVIMEKIIITALVIAHAHLIIFQMVKGGAFMTVRTFQVLIGTIINKVVCVHHNI
jgi:hypothetical protein